MNHTLPLTKADQWISDSMDSFSMSSGLLFQSYFDSYVDACQMVGKKLIFIDLYAGSGTQTFNNKFYQNPAMYALEYSEHVEKYIYLESDADNFEALEARIERDYPNANVDLFPSSAHLQIDRLTSILENYNSDEYQVLCYINPNRFDLPFYTVSELARFETDFLVVHKVPEKYYENPRAFITSSLEKLDSYLDLVEWAIVLDNPKYELENMSTMFADIYVEHMEYLDFPKLDLRHPLKQEKDSREDVFCVYSKQPWAHDAYTKSNLMLEQSIPT